MLVFQNGYTNLHFKGATYEFQLLYTLINPFVYPYSFIFPNILSLSTFITIMLGSDYFEHIDQYAGL